MGTSMTTPGTVDISATDPTDPDPTRPDPVDPTVDDPVDLSTLPPPPPPPGDGHGPVWGRPPPPRWGGPGDPPPQGPPARPPRRTWAWMALGTVLAVPLLVFGVYQVAALLAHEETTTVRTYPAADIVTLEVRNDGGSVHVVGADVDEITVTAEISHGLRRTGHGQRVEGDRLVLDGTCPNFGSVWCDVTYRVEVPTGTDIDLDAEEEVEVRGIDGAVRVHTSNASVEASDLGGQVDLRSSNGSVRATRLTSEVTEARSSNGSVRVSFREPPRAVTAVTSNGAVEVVVPDDGEPYAVDIDTSNGSTDNSVSTDPVSQRHIAARTSNGSATVRYAD